MIFLAGKDGSFKTAIPSSVYQGSNYANEVILIAPYPKGYNVQVCYKLPNGKQTILFYMNPLTKNLEDESLNGFGIWATYLDENITNQSGLVTGQFFINLPKETVSTGITSSGNITTKQVQPVVATYDFSFQVNGIGSPTQYVSLTDIGEINRYLGVLGVNINKNADNIENNTNDITEIKGDIEDLDRKTNSNISLISQLQEIVATLEESANDSFNPSDGSYNSRYTGAQIERAIEVVTDTTSEYGIEKTNDGLKIVQATESDINSATNVRKPITSNNVKYATKKALTDPKTKWSQEDQQKARDTLGVGQNGETKVFGNPTGQANETLEKIQIGDTIYEIGNDMIKGTSAPTTSTVGEIGQFYIDTTSGTSYQCTSIVDGVYTWVKLIKETEQDKATDKNFGLVKLVSGSGIWGADGGLRIVKASNTDVDNKKDNYKPIVSSILDYAVKSGLANTKLEWTDEERAKARETLGITDSGLTTRVNNLETKTTNLENAIIRVGGDLSDYIAENNEAVYSITDRVTELENSGGASGSGTLVVANPSGSATSTLNKLKVGSVVYDFNVKPIDSVPTQNTVGELKNLYITDTNMYQMIKHDGTGQYTWTKVLNNESVSTYILSSSIDYIYSIDLGNTIAYINTPKLGVDAPTESTTGVYLGQLYQCVNTDPSLYQLISITNGKYKWEKLNKNVLFYHEVEFEVEGSSQTRCWFYSIKGDLIVNHNIANKLYIDSSNVLSIVGNVYLEIYSGIQTINIDNYAEYVIFDDTYEFIGETSTEVM